MGLFELQLSDKQFKRLDLLLNGLVGAVNRESDAVTQALEKVAEAIAKIQPLPQPQPQLLEVKFMYILKNDHPAVPFSLVLGDVTDAEGETIPDAKLDVTVESDSPGVVAVTFDPATRAGEISFGTSGSANLTATVKSGETLLGAGAAAFTITTGDPAAISAVDLTFEGIDEAPLPEEPV